MATYDQYLAQLHPSVRGIAQQFLEEAVAAGLDPRVQEAFRSRERQDELYSQGRTAPGAVVTKARGGQSNHNYGVAFDVVPGALVGQKNWAPDSPLWGQLGEIGRKHGLEWGGDWKFVDKPHFQLHGANWRSMQDNPEFAHYRGDGHSHAPSMPGAPAPALEPAVQVADRPVAPIQTAVGNPAAPAIASEKPSVPGQGGLGAILAAMAPTADALTPPKGAEEVRVAPTDGGMAPAMAAQQGVDLANGLRGGVMPDIASLIGLGKRKLV